MKKEKRINRTKYRMLGTGTACRGVCSDMKGIEQYMHVEEFETWECNGINGTWSIALDQIIGGKCIVSHKRL